MSKKTVLFQGCITLAVMMEVDADSIQEAVKKVDSILNTEVVRLNHLKIPTFGGRNVEVIVNDTDVEWESAVLKDEEADVYQEIERKKLEQKA